MWSFSGKAYVQKHHGFGIEGRGICLLASKAKQSEARLASYGWRLEAGGWRLGIVGYGMGHLEHDVGGDETCVCVCGGTFRIFFDFPSPYARSLYLAIAFTNSRQ